MNARHDPRAPYEDPPRSVVWELTLACNLRCAHCASGGGRPREDELTHAEAMRLCEDLAGLGTKAVCLFGGEFHLREDWEAIGERLRSLGMDVSASTNGYAFDEAMGERLKRLEIDGISISLDAADPALHDALRGRPGAHARALRAIRTVDAMGFEGKTIITSVTRRNLGELDRMADLILDGIEATDWMWMINIASCHDPERFGASSPIGRKDYLQLAETLNRLRPAHLGQLDITGSHDLGYFSWQYPEITNFQWQGCRAGIDTLGIHSEGSVKGCLILPDAFIEGNLRETPLADLWRSPERFGLVRRFTPDLLEGACKGCAFGEICMGGCKDLAYSTTGSPYHYPFCLHREELEAARGEGHG